MDFSEAMGTGLGGKGGICPGPIPAPCGWQQSAGSWIIDSHSNPPTFPWHPFVSLHHLPCPDMSVCVPNSPFHKDTGHIGLKPNDLTLT